jgi:diguanylate cyclase (GGDEF)-like protein
VNADDGRWTLVERGAAPIGDLSAVAQGSLVFGAGSLISILAAILLLLLARSRDRALGLVDETTGQLRHQSLHDSLTGLPNRVLVRDRAEQMLARARRNRMPIALLYVDVDGLRHINETYGHSAGDALLRIVANRLLSVIRESDTVARVAGDEFVVLLEGPSLDGGAEMVADRVLEVLREPYELGGAVGRRLVVTATLGIVAGMRETADELLRDADVALYEAKAAGKDRYAVFESSMQAAVHERMTLEQDLTVAAEHGELFLLYQPIFELASERLVGVEALLRWRHPTRGIVQPDDFIPLAEASGLIVPIGRWALERACRDAAGWRADGGLSVAVNVSALQLDSDGLIDDVRRALARSGLDPAGLTLEVTETALMRDAPATVERLAALKRQGVRIAIDDFGTGYSSLAYLRQFPVDAIKIDRSFVRGIASSPESEALVQILVRLGKALHLETLAEGIETPAQLAAVQRQQCDRGQGFLFARPLAAPAIDTLLARQHRVDDPAAALPERPHALTGAGVEGCES